MSRIPLDFRSDTVTQPTAGMRAAMAQAPVGDDVFDEDPTIHELQDRVSQLLGKEAALLVPSGTMSNHIAIRLHCAPGDEMICEAGCHLLNLEQAAYAQLSGVAARPIEGRFGVLRAEQLEGVIRPPDDHLPRTRMLTLENTHNRGGGRIQPHDAVQALCMWAHDHHLTTHLDGARLLNAVVATGIPAARWAEHFDTVSMCFSKGLGAPVGSALAGPRDWIRLARRHRKVLGGGMRQAGILAAAALYALDHHVERLAEDHDHAQRLAAGIRQLEGLQLIPPDVQTNIVIFEVAPEIGTGAQIVGRLRERGLLMHAIAANRIRAVTHLDVGRDDVDRAVEILEDVIAQSTRAAAPSLRR
jgi:threonine aldolase